MIITNIFLTLSLVILFQQINGALISDKYENDISNQGDQGDLFTEEAQQYENMGAKSSLTTGLPKGGDLLSRINEKLASINVLDDQQLKRLEALEYKLTRFEVTQQERSEGLRSDLQELSRRVQNMEWIATKSETTLDQIRADLDVVRTVHEGNAKRKQEKNLQTAEVPSKLHELANIANVLRSGLVQLERGISSISRNISIMMNVTKDIHLTQRSVPTKQFLNNALLNLRSQPVYINIEPTSNTFVPSDSNKIQLPTSCDGPKKNTTELLKIRIQSNKSPVAFFVRCELIENRPWMVIQNREDGSVNFFKAWVDYVNGFGNLNGEYWIGLEKLHLITSNAIQELLIVLEDFEGNIKTAHYSAFAIAGEREQYALSVLGAYNGTAGDSFSYHAGHKFSTFDFDNDGWKEGSCADTHQGAWWYNACDMSNLNGRYLSGQVQGDKEGTGVFWNDFHGNVYSLKSAMMLIRPVQNHF